MQNQGNNILGKHYSIRSHQTDKVYIGSTTRKLSTRFSEHKTHYKLYMVGKYNKCMSFELFCYDDVYIELVHEGLFESKKDLYRMEGEYIQATQNCINKQVAGRTTQEHYQDNRERIQEYRKNYDAPNKENIKERKAQ